MFANKQYLMSLNVKWILFVNKLPIAIYITSPLSAFLTEPSGCHTAILKRECVAVKVELS